MVTRVSVQTDDKLVVFLYSLMRFGGVSLGSVEQALDYVNRTAEKGTMLDGWYAPIAQSIASDLTGEGLIKPPSKGETPSPHEIDVV